MLLHHQKEFDHHFGHRADEHLPLSRSFRIDNGPQGISKHAVIRHGGYSAFCLFFWWIFSHQSHGDVVGGIRCGNSLFLQNVTVSIVGCIPVAGESYVSLETVVINVDFTRCTLTSFDAILL